MVVNVNGKPAIQVNAIVKAETEKAYLLECDGDAKWFPKSTVRLNPADQTADIQEWVYKQNFPEG